MSSLSFRRANEVLRIETMMFEKYLKRVDPKDITLQTTATGKSHCLNHCSLCQICTIYWKLHGICMKVADVPSAA